MRSPTLRSATLIAVIGTLGLYVFCLLATGNLLSGVGDAHVSLKLLGLEVFRGERIDRTTTVSPTWGFVVFVLGFLVLVFGAWLWLRRLVGTRNSDGDDRITADSHHRGRSWRRQR